MVVSEGMIGKLVAGRYRISRRLSGGGMGTVYVALQEPLGREVALKVVRRELAKDALTVERFRREAMSLAQVHHPHIVALYDFGELDDGALYFAMELVKGDNLRQRLVKRGPLPVRTGVAIARQTCAALACAHGLGIIHRDLKPENLLLMDAPGAPDFVKIVDFGVAKLTGIDDERGAQGEHLTAHGSVVGTPGYIAPEVSVRGVTTDPRSDLYALGVLWFECLAGRPPFKAPTATALLMAHAVDPIPPLPSEIPLPIAGLVQRLLAKDPNDRPDNADALAQLLDQLPLYDSGAIVARPVPTQTAPGAHTLDEQACATTFSPAPGLPADTVKKTQAAMLVPTLPSSPTEATAPMAQPADATLPTRSGRRGLLLAAGGAILGAAAAWGLLRGRIGEPARSDGGTAAVVDAGPAPGSDAGGRLVDAEADAGSPTAIDQGPDARPDPLPDPLPDPQPDPIGKPRPRPREKPRAVGHVPDLD